AVQQARGDQTRRRSLPALLAAAAAFVRDYRSRREKRERQRHCGPTGTLGSLWPDPRRPLSFRKPIDIPYVHVVVFCSHSAGNGGLSILETAPIRPGGKVADRGLGRRRHCL